MRPSNCLLAAAVAATAVAALVVLGVRPRAQWSVTVTGGLTHGAGMLGDGGFQWPEASAHRAAQLCMRVATVHVPLAPCHHASCCCPCLCMARPAWLSDDCSITQYLVYYNGGLVATMLRVLSPGGNTPYSHQPEHPACLPQPCTTRPRIP